MKSLKITLLFLVLTASMYAQSGMVFQGIARDNNSAAITDTPMTFTFRVTQSDGTDLYKETQLIRTDNFGVFSHVIGTGNAVTNTFASVDFSQGNLKAIISVNKDGTDIQIYDQPFQYTAYAKHSQTSDDGVPIGTVVAFMGNEDKIPDGWILADGRDITGAEYAKLRAVLNNDAYVPNLKGEFLKGAGSTVDGTNIQEVAVRTRQIQNLGVHNHAVSINGATNNDGLHRHTVKHSKAGTPAAVDGGNFHLEWGNSEFDNSAYWDNSGTDVHPTLVEKWVSQRYSSHQHNFNVSGDTGGRKSHIGGQNQNENRPDNYGVYWIIRYK